jgi:hypothetical protein
VFYCRSVIFEKYLILKSIYFFEIYPVTKSGLTYEFERFYHIFENIDMLSKLLNHHYEKVMVITGSISNPKRSHF